MREDIVNPKEIGLPPSSLVRQAYQATVKGNPQQYYVVHPAELHMGNKTTNATGAFTVSITPLQKGATAAAAVIQGKMPYNMIFAENVSNPTAAKLGGSIIGGQFGEHSAALRARGNVLWPSPR